MQDWKESTEIVILFTMPAIEDMTEPLLLRQNPDGGWGSGPERPADTESTALALMALAAETGDGAGRAVERGIAWLSRRQQADGAWPHSDSAPVASWATALAALALERFGERTSARAAGLWLLAREGRGYPWYIRLYFRLFPDQQGVALDPELRGWPWTAGTFSWVEPTAYALIALKRLRSVLPRETARDRIEEGERMILDRTCSGGGWNYGNSRVLGEDLWPYPDMTALALLALRDVPPRPEIRTGRRVLVRLTERNRSTLVLSLTTLCLRAYGDDRSAAYEPLLTERLRERGDDLSTRSLALALQALASESPLILGPT